MQAPYLVRDFWAHDFAIYLEPLDAQSPAIPLADMAESGSVNWHLEGLRILGVDTIAKANLGLLSFGRARGSR